MKKLFAIILSLLPAACPAAWLTNPYTTNNQAAADAHVLSLGTYTLPPATTNALGGVKVDGTTTTITAGGVLSVIGSTASGGSNGIMWVTNITYQTNKSYVQNMGSEAVIHSIVTFTAAGTSGGSQLTYGYYGATNNFTNTINLSGEGASYIPIDIPFSFVVPTNATFFFKDTGTGLNNATAVGSKPSQVFVLSTIGGGGGGGGGDAYLSHNQTFTGSNTFSQQINGSITAAGTATNAPASGFTFPGSVDNMTIGTNDGSFGSQSFIGEQLINSREADVLWVLGDSNGSGSLNFLGNTANPGSINFSSLLVYGDTTATLDFEGRISAPCSSNTISGIFTGNGNGLTNIPPSAISGGTWAGYPRYITNFSSAGPYTNMGAVSNVVLRWQPPTNTFLSIAGEVGITYNYAAQCRVWVTYVDRLGTTNSFPLVGQPANSISMAANVITNFSMNNLPLWVGTNGPVTVAFVNGAGTNNVWYDFSLEQKHP